MSKHFVCNFFVGLLLGSLCQLGLQFYVLPCLRLRDQDNNDALIRSRILNGRPRAKLSTDENLVLIGVMTAKALLESRVIPAYDTWVSSIPGKVIFFSSEGSHLPSRPDIPVVSLPGIDDSYPPQRKSLAMIKYMHDHYRDHFRFFMRADDDIYIRGDILGRFLHSINSTGRALYIGQAGLGNKEEFGLLSLSSEQNFCMGGPGMIFSRETLVRTVPHIAYCVNHLITTHEDVEVGRCVNRFADVTCTWAYEMQKIMYNNYREPKGSFTHSLRNADIHRAATLHPVKNAAYQYRLHTYLLSRKTDDLRNRLSKLQRIVSDMTQLLQDRDEFYSQNRYGLHPSLLKSLTRTPDAMKAWDFLFSRSVSSIGHSNPKRGQEEDLKIGLDDIVSQVMQSINHNARQRGRVIDFKELLYGYRRLNPLHGPDYMLDLLLVYRKFKGKRKMTVPVRRHAYLQQAFLEPELRSVSIDSTFSARVNIVLPLAGRYKTFLRFMDNLEECCFSQEGSGVALAVVLFHEAGEADEILSRISVSRSRFPQVDIRVENVSGPFSRGVGLQQVVKLYPRDALVVFMDVDIYIHLDVIHRIRRNTVMGKSVYYPVVFSQYDPQMTGVPNSISSVSEDIGYWRDGGYGILSAYNGDFIDSSGFDLEIRGWGREDVDLFSKFIAHNFTIFRAADIGLVHIFHSIICDPNLDPGQYQMCLGSKARSFASFKKLSKYVRETPEIYRRHGSALGSAKE